MKQTFKPSRLKRARTHGFPSAQCHAQWPQAVAGTTCQGPRAVDALALSIRQARADTDHEQAPQPSREPSFAFPRSARLLDSGSYNRVFAGARRSADRYFTVLARARAVTDEPFSEPFGAARLGLAIAKRSAPRAVARNRIKRVIRESFRHARAELPCVDLVVLCRRAAVDADNATLRAALATHWQELGQELAR